MGDQFPPNRGRGAHCGPETTLGLLRKARGGDEGALNRLYERILPVVRRWARGRVPRQARDVLDTDDLVQETLARTLARVREFEPRRDHGLYLYLREALRNRIRDELRRVERLPGTAASVPSQIPADEADPLEQAIGRQALDRYEQALERLGPEERAMVVGRIEFGLGWREIAEMSDKSSEDAARMAVSRALSRIAEELGDDR